MANCNCNDFPISCAPHAPGGDCYHPHSCPPHPCPPPPFKGGTSMYIGARYVPIFADPVEWDDEREYEPLTIVIHDGSCYTSKCYVPKGAQLPPYPEGQTKYWVKTSDYNYQFADLKKTVLDLSRLVEQFQKDYKTFADLINGWNEKVQQWETEMTAWGGRLDAVESRITDLAASLNAEIDRAKAAEQANAAAIAQETADRKQAISELDAAYKAADAAEAQAREEADTALSNRITANKTDIDALKAEQAIQNTNISKNAKNIADNSAEIAKHAERLTGLESNASDWDEAFPGTTIAQEVLKEELARANGDKALNGRCDTIAADVEEVRDIANHKVDTTTYTEGQSAQDAQIAANRKIIEDYGTWQQAQDSRLTALEGDNTTNKTDIENIKAKDTAQDAAIQQNKDAIAHVTGSLSGYVKTETYTEGQAAQDTKITAAQATADKADTTIGDWETDHPGQTISQCATSLENETAANAAKTIANAAAIGDWNAEHPGKTIAQAVTDVSGSIPDVSGFVTETTYNQGQAAQDAKITELTGKLADINYLAFLDKLYPEDAIIKEPHLDKTTLFPHRYEANTRFTLIQIPVNVPYIVSAFMNLWTAIIDAPTTIIMYDAAGAAQSKPITEFKLDMSSGSTFFAIHIESPFNIPTTGVYYYRLQSTGILSYYWMKNETPFSSLA